MSDEPLEKFGGYLTLAHEALGSAPPSVSRGTLRLVHSSPATLAERVSPLEATEEFRALWQILETRLGNNGFGSRGWDHSVGNWFRRSGIYHRIAVGKPLPDIRSLLDSLCAELARRESTITYLALVQEALQVPFRVGSWPNLGESSSHASPFRGTPVRSRTVAVVHPIPMGRSGGSRGSRFVHGSTR